MRNDIKPGNKISLTGKYTIVKFSKVGNILNNPMGTGKKVILGTAILALFGTVTNYVYLSPLLTLFLPLCVLVFRKENIPRSIFWLYVFTGIFLLSAILYDWHSIFTYGFYRRDGNFIISYSPLLVLPLFSFKFELKKVIRYFIVLFFAYTVSILFTIRDPPPVLLYWLYHLRRVVLCAQCFWGIYCGYGRIRVVLLLPSWRNERVLLFLCNFYNVNYDLFKGINFRVFNGRSSLVLRHYQEVQNSGSNYCCSYHIDDPITFYCISLL